MRENAMPENAMPENATPENAMPETNHGSMPETCSHTALQDDIPGLNEVALTEADVVPDGAEASNVNPAVTELREAPAKQTSGIVDWLLRVLAGFYLVAVLVMIVGYRTAATRVFSRDLVLAVYGATVATYLLSRFFISVFYRPHEDVGLEPHVAIVVPSFNEEDAIAASLQSLLALDYPREKLELVAVNDGSTDGTLAEMERVAALAPGRVRVIDFPENRGKRAGMAAGIRATTAEVVAFVDSDSIVEPDGLRQLVQPFADVRVGAVCGHADVLNIDENWMAKMQAVRYYIAFRVLKAAESCFGCVTCCSGCFSAYRRSAIAPHVDWWENQRFLGVPSTFGDDRSLTNCVLRKWRVTYQSSARSHTAVPIKFKQFMRQQARWKRSWAREATILARIIWRKPLPAALAVYVGLMLPILGPIVAARALLAPFLTHTGFSVLYPFGVYAMALTYGLYYAACQSKYGARWAYGIVFVGFYLVFLLWQTYWAILTIRTAKWGTRPATAGMDGIQHHDELLPASTQPALLTPARPVEEAFAAHQHSPAGAMVLEEA
jgi:hyaluronan synthase